MVPNFVTAFEEKIPHFGISNKSITRLTTETPHELFFIGDMNKNRSTKLCVYRYLYEIKGLHQLLAKMHIIHPFCSKV